MSVNNTFSRRSLLISATLLVAVAILVAITVIPQVRAEFLRGGTPETAVYAFWVNVILTVFVAIVLWFVATRTKSRRSRPWFVLSLMSLIILLVGWSLNDAGRAYGSHDPAMQTATIILHACAAVDLLALLMVIMASIRFRKQIDNG
jgi:phosphoglycerol transferase MdoB-like AlkP superfamily enzyme